MTSHLRVTAGGHELLLPGGSVRRVAEGGDARDDLPILDLAQLLGGTPGSVVIHYGDEESGEGLLAVDEVKGLVNVAERMLVRLPPLSPQFARYFDSIAIEAIDGHHPLCLRARLNLQAA
jgi:hypothetical protein